MISIYGAPDLSWDGTYNAGVISLFADTESEIETTGQIFDTIRALQGSRCTACDTGAEYMMDSTGTWHKLPSRQTQIILPDVYSESEVDALLAPITSNIDDIQTVDTRQDGVLEDLIDNGAKNLLSKNEFSQTGRWATDVDVNLPPGKYIAYFGSLTTTDTDGTRNQLGFFNESYQSAVKNGAYPQVDRGEGVYTEFELVETCVKFRLYSADTAAHGEGDTVTASNVMICTKDAWDLSQEYVSYCPNLKDVYEHKAAVSFTPGGTISSLLNCTFTIPDSSRTLRFTIGKLNATQNYLQVYVNGVDKGYIIFDVSRNIDNWGE